MSRLLLIPATLLFILGLHSIQAKSQSCNPQDFAVKYVEAYKQATPIKNTSEASQKIDTLAQGKCHQAEVVKLLEESMGARIGYKVAATSKKAQQQSGINGPIVGVLLAQMLLPSGSTIATNSGGTLIYEVDFLAKVKSKGINDARTIMDVARHLDAVYPFIEVPDLMLPRGSKFTGPLIVAMNVGARWGVVGKPIEVKADREFLDALAKMRVTMYDESGKLITQAKGSDILGHPFNSVLFLLEELRQQGELLQPGDLLSLGTFGRFYLAAPGKRAIAIYQGIDEVPATVLVKFK